MLNGKPLALDVAFTNGDINYPANWMRNATLAEKNAIGITEVSGPAWYDQRFYWGVDKPKTLADLKTQWIDNQKATAGSLLSKTDWMIIRKEEASTAVPDATQTYRASVRKKCKQREDQITACSTTDELAAMIGDGKRQGAEKKDGSGKSFNPKQYEADIVLEAWPTE